MPTSLLTFLICVLIVAVYFDMRRGVIPNAITMPAFFIMFLIGYFAGGMDLLKMQFLGAAAAWAVWWLIWSLKMVGGGDQKLITVVGAAVGWPLIGSVMLAVGILGGVLALVWLAVLRFYGQWPGLRVALKTVSVPYSVAIGLGTILILTLRYVDVILFQ